MRGFLWVASVAKSEYRTSERERRVGVTREYLIPVKVPVRDCAWEAVSEGGGLGREVELASWGGTGAASGPSVDCHGGAHAGHPNRYQWGPRVALPWF
jgi:hypothetical protein